MNTEFSNVTILGSGLLGGSLAMALAETQPGTHVQLWARRSETVDAAKKLGIAGATDDLEVAVKDCHLLILAVPVGAMAELITTAIQSGLPKDCIITDVGSVKAAPHATIRRIISGTGLTFVGSHPMAGSEQGGIESASSGLFQGAACLLTNDEQASDHVSRAVESFWQNVGCHTKWMNAADHDSLVACISHLPHILASSAARICLEIPANGKFGGGGLRDTTRVAAGNPDMWAEILTENRQALIEPLRNTIKDLTHILSRLEAGDQDATRQWLTTAKDRRDVLNQ